MILTHYEGREKTGNSKFVPENPTKLVPTQSLRFDFDAQPKLSSHVIRQNMVPRGYKALNIIIFFKVRQFSLFIKKSWQNHRGE